ncbi:zinc finger and SCAN domain-containing protein 5B [Ditylenchus destructor]|nr:zinc finger and SCAN domain-containing protein 5B [Ditylenchus destructor]
MYKLQTPDLDELRELLKNALLEQKKEKSVRNIEKQLDGVATTISRLRNPEKFKERVTLNEDGAVINGTIKQRPSTSQPVVMTPMPVVIRTQSADEIAGAVAHPTKPSEIRKLIRSKMVRCKRCKNRFTEKHLYERHLRDKHHIDYLEYVIKQEEEMQLQRKEELEANRLEEIVSGGFIPPAEDLDSKNFDVDIETIPLPGELTNGIPARFDKYGILYQPKRTYKKKISPQCPFCDKRYRNEHSLKKHITKKHPECIEFVQCLKCFKAIPSKDDMDSHLCEMIYVCFECTPVRNLCNEVRLYNHRAKFHRGTNSGFKCNLCNLKFLTPRKLRKHKKMSHVFTKTYACHFCEELFTSETSVTTHERIHTGIIKFECKICDFKCNRFLAMEEHKKEEHGYLCSVCQEKLAEYSDIKNHTLVEHGGYLSSDIKSGHVESPRVWVMFKGE